MAKRWALIVAAGNPHYAGIGGPSHADADALAFASALAKSGMPASQQIVLVGQNATKAVVDSRIRSLAKRLKRDDKLYIYLGTRVLLIRNVLHFTCWDTLPDDPQRTSVDIVEMLKLLSKNDTHLITFVDYSAGPPIPNTLEGNGVFEIGRPKGSDAIAVDIRGQIFSFVAVVSNHAVEGVAKIAVDFLPRKSRDEFVR